MPCVTPPYSDEELRRAAENRAKSALEDRDRFKGMLCDVCQELETHSVAVPEHIKPWYDAHCGQEREKIKADALAKLTPRERRALGLEP
jgi:hypothetical protein